MASKMDIMRLNAPFRRSVLAPFQSLSLFEDLAAKCFSHVADRPLIFA
jgi:hypothetical protein